MDLICCILSAAIRGADVSLGSLECSGGKTVLTMAAVAGRPDVVRWLLTAAPATTALIDQPDKGGARALHYAALESHAHVCEVLVEGGASPDVADGTGVRPLHLAAESGSVDTCRALVEGGANVNTSDEESVTPLLLAAEARHVEVCSYLTSKRANPLASSI